MQFLEVSGEVRHIYIYIYIYIYVFRRLKVKDDVLRTQIVYRPMRWTKIKVEMKRKRNVTSCLS